MESVKQSEGEGLVTKTTKQHANDGIDKDTINDCNGGSRDTVQSEKTVTVSQVHLSTPSPTTDLTDTVAKHYNELQEAGLESRKESRIFYMRNFNNWIKSVVIGDTLQRIKNENSSRDADISVLDLGSGKGGDLLKWKKGGISSLVCADIASTSVEQSESRYNEMLERNQRERFPGKQFTAEFIAADCTKVRLRDRYKNAEMKFNLCSCQFSFHYCFESFPQAEMMLRNASENLKLGGYFIGTTPNSQELIRRLRESDDMSFGNEVYRVTFDGDDKENIALFGARYMFHLEGVVDCPEFLVYFPVLEKMAEKYGLKLIHKTPFADFFNTNVKNWDHKGLLNKMQALEQFPPPGGGSLTGLVDTDYRHAEKRLQQMKDAETEEQARSRRHPLTLGTLSKAEWEAITIYCVFMFQKQHDIDTGEEWKQDPGNN